MNMDHDMSTMCMVTKGQYCESVMLCASQGPRFLCVQSYSPFSFDGFENL